MVKITVDDSVVSKLHNLDSRLELCDESGKTLGFFVPAAEQKSLLYAWACDQFSEDELERARRESGGEPLAAILADLSSA